MSNDHIISLIDRELSFLQEMRSLLVGVPIIPESSRQIESALDPALTNMHLPYQPTSVRRKVQRRGSYGGSVPAKEKKKSAVSTATAVKQPKAALTANIPIGPIAVSAEEARRVREGITRVPKILDS